MSKSPRYRTHDGFLMPMGFPVEAFESALTYRADAGDVFVATYPKCGTTWMQHMVWLLGHGGRPLTAEQRLTEVFPHLEEVGAELVRRLSEPRLVKTHLPFHMAPLSDEARYIYVARNPFDCVVSFYHHTRGFVRHYDFADGTFDDYFECFLAGRVDWGSYFDHLVSWAAQSESSNVLFTTFEAMKSDPADVVARVGEFLGGTFGATARDPALAARVLEHSSFGKMRRDQRRWASERPATMPPFVRKGQVGDWENQMSASQARRLAQEFDRRTAGTRLGALWPEVLERARGMGSERA